MLALDVFVVTASFRNVNHPWRWFNIVFHWPSSLLSCQGWRHVGSRWRLWSRGHHGCGSSCGGAAPQAYGQPVEQPAVLNQTPTPAARPEVISIWKHLRLQNQLDCNHCKSASLADLRRILLFRFLFNCVQNENTPGVEYLSTRPRLFKEVTLLLKSMLLPFNKL